MTLALNWKSRVNWQQVFPWQCLGLLKQAVKISRVKLTYDNLDPISRPQPEIGHHDITQIAFKTHPAIFDLRFIAQCPQLLARLQSRLPQ